MKLEVGKRYVLRNGYITNVIQENSHSEYAFKDGSLTWKASGEYSIIGVLSPLDIVSEYIEKDAEMKPDEPQQPLRWVENCKPDKPGIWLRMGEKSITGYVVDVGDLQGDDAFDWEIATRCYLGPIPEIQPPVKKVVERLYMKQVTENRRDVIRAMFEPVWIAEGEVIDADWIHTSETREREI